MNARLTQALSDLERHTPDPAQVMAGVRTGIVRSKRRRRYGTAAATVATVLAVIGGALNVGSLGLHPRPRIAGPLSLEVPTPTPTPTPTPGQTITSAPMKKCHQLRLDWLPAGLSTPPIRSCDSEATSVLYPLIGAPNGSGSPGPYLRVELDNTDWQPPLDLPGWTRVTINGRAGRVATRPTRTMLRFPLPSRQWVSIEYGLGMPGGKSQRGLAAIATRIAEHATEAPAATIRARFAPTWLPDGLTLRSITAGPSGETVTYTDGPGRTAEPTRITTEDGIVDVDRWASPDNDISISWQPDGRQPPRTDGTERLPDIQGLPAYFGFGAVTVLGFHGGSLDVQGHSRRTAPSPSATAQPGPSGPVPSYVDRDELVRIAAGVRWLG